MGETILVIDDDRLNIFALSAVLKAKGYACVAAQGMDEAFAVLRIGCTNWHYSY